MGRQKQCFAFAKSWFKVNIHMIILTIEQMIAKANQGEASTKRKEVEDESDNLESMY